MTKKEKLQADLEKAQALNRLFKSADCQNYLVPALKSMAEVRWLDVEKFKDKDAFVYKYQEMKAKANAYDELLRLLERMEEAEKKLSEQLKTPETTYAI